MFSLPPSQLPKEMRRTQLSYRLHCSDALVRCYSTVGVAAARAVTRCGSGCSTLRGTVATDATQTAPHDDAAVAAVACGCSTLRGTVATDATPAACGCDERCFTATMET